MTRRALLSLLLAPLVKLFQPKLELVITRVDIVARPRKLKGTWTMERAQDLRVLHGMPDA